MSAVHHINFLRGSAVLFTTVIASSSLFFRKDLSAALMQHSRTLINRSLLAGHANVSVVQSLMLTTYFKVSKLQKMD
jgi:hypothetical protein